MVRRIEGTSGVEVYVGQNGHVCLKQDDFGNDSVIIIHPAHIPLVVKWLQEAAAQVEGVPVGIVETDDDDEE